MKRIGILYPSSGISEFEMQRLLPKGVSLHITRIPMEMPTYDAELHMIDYVEGASKLLADARVDIIAFGCTMGSLIKGKGYDQEIIKRIEQATGLRATTTTTAVMTGLKTLGIKKLILFSPYAKLLHQMEKAYLEGEGFQVLNNRTLELADCFKQYDMDPLQWYEIVKELKSPMADGYFVSCGGIRVVDIIRQLEIDLGKPVITSNQALVWHCLRKIGIQEAVEGFGCLLTFPL